MLDASLLKPAKRTYLNILEDFMRVVRTDFARWHVSGSSKIATDISNGDYDLLGKKSLNNTLPKLLKLLETYALKEEMERVVNKAIGRTINDQREMEMFIAGLTNSLTMSDADKKKLAQYFRENPALIYARLLELMDLRR